MQPTAAKRHAAGRWTDTLALLAASGVLVACGGGDSEADDTSTTPTSSATSTATAATETTKPSTTKAPSTSSGPRPSILSFSTPENIDCHNGNFQQFSASWTTKNATKTTISIDGGGLYKSYGPSADTSLPFNCSSSHRFVLTAIGANGQKATKSITLQPRNAQTDDDDDDEDQGSDS